MNETIKLILSLSFSGSILAVLIFALKPFIKHRLSKSIQYYIWIVVLLRFIIPYSFEGSIMNDIFYDSDNTTPVRISTQGTEQLKVGTGQNTVKTSELPNAAENVTRTAPDSDTDQNMNLMGQFNKYGIYLWLLGIMAALSVNLTGYIRLSKHLKKENRPATDEQNRILAALWNGRYNVRLVRNRFVTTPMLIGILKPHIIIPDIDFDEDQLKNILLHEISHLRRFDIGVKWLSVITLSIHWFNPLMYFIIKEINRACELACDESVIKKLNSAEKQAYGDTLISVVAEHKYPVGMVQATMCEEKRTLKERLIAIMKHNKKSKLTVIFSLILIGLFIAGALYLGAGIGVVGVGRDTPPDIYVSAEGDETKTALMGSYDWAYRGKRTHADAIGVLDFNYRDDNMISVTAGQQLAISTQKLESDGKYAFTLEKVSVYKGGKQIEIRSGYQSSVDGIVHIQAPQDVGEYIYNLELSFKDNGAANYGFVVKTVKEGQGSKPSTAAAKIDDLLSLTMSPAAPSNADDYINAHKPEYDAVAKMDTEALPYLFSEFEKGNQTGLKGHVMERLCRKILSGEDIKYASRDPQDWYDTYKAHMLGILDKNAYEFVKKSYPKGSIVLDLTQNYEVVNFSDGQVEIAGRKLEYKAVDLGSLYKEIGSARVEQMMYRAVAFYNAASARDYDTVNRLASQDLKDELKRWADNTSRKDEYSAIHIMKLDNYTDTTFPIKIWAPKRLPTGSHGSGRYSVNLGLSSGIQAQVYFTIPNEGRPLVEGFRILHPKGGSAKIPNPDGE